MNGTANKENALAVFEAFKIRRVYDEKAERWYFSVVDIVAALIQQPDHQAARKYWNKLKERHRKEGSESVSNCHRLKLPAADGKLYFTDAADSETLLRRFTVMAEISTRQIAEGGEEWRMQRQTGTQEIGK